MVVGLSDSLLPTVFSSFFLTLNRQLGMRLPRSQQLPRNSEQGWGLQSGVRWSKRQLKDVNTMF